MVFKKVLKNLAIFLGVLIGIALITLACLYFIPNLTIFGIRFKKAGINDSSYKNLMEYESECESITLNLGHVNLDVVVANDDYRTGFSFNFRDDARGLVKADKADLYYTIKLEGKNLIINFIEPEGWIFWKDTWATLTLSQNWLTSSNKKIITNVSDGKVSISTSAGENGFRSAFTTKFEYVEFNATGKGTFEITDNVADCKIHSEKGKSILSGYNDTVKYITNKGELEFFAIGELNASVKNSYIHGNTIGGSFNFSGGDGKIVISKIGNDGQEAQTTITGGNVTTKLSNVTSKIKLSVTKGDVEIGNYHTAEYYLNEIRTDKSKIQVYNISAKKLSIISNKGQIISSASGEGELTITNNTGKTTFTGENSSGEKFTGKVSLTSGNGEINLNKITSAVTAETTGRGKINAQLNSINGETNLKTNKGKISLKVNIAESFIINAQSARRNLIVSLSSIGINFQDKSHQEKSVNVGGSDGTNKINLYAANADIQVTQI